MPLRSLPATLRGHGPSVGARAFVLLSTLLSCSEPSSHRPIAAVKTGIKTVAAPVMQAAAPDVRRLAALDSATCADSEMTAIFASPRSPSSGRSLRIMVVAEHVSSGALTVRDPSGEEAVYAAERHGGPPYFWVAEVPSPRAGIYRAALVDGEGEATAMKACRDVVVTAEPAAEPPPSWSAVWPVSRAWDVATENFYSAWIETLFDASLAEQPSWPALHVVLRDRSRNFLHDYLGAAEDEDGPRALMIEPDCADFPYFLRAYFAFKLGLPFGYSSCTRGGSGSPPSCTKWRSNLTVAPRGNRFGASAFGDFLRVRLADSVHSGNARVPAAGDDGDYYPVALSAETLRPGTVYADPYGHVLVLAKRIDQTKESGGVLLAVDGQPDGTISRRRFWKGNFLFDLDPALGSPGWKRFRPVVVDARGAPSKLANAAIAGLSLQQYELGVEGFYDRMEEVLSPAPLDPVRALDETIQALDEQVRARLLSIENGEKYKARERGLIDMPTGPAIFETVGPWEDFSTPSRDLRLLIAIDVVRGFAARVERRPSRYAMPEGKSAAEVGASLAARLESEGKSRRFSYVRSDGSTFELTLADVIARAEALEMAYNPNDCVEVRWGAEEGSDEASTCRRRAPWKQLSYMRRYRPWFHDRKRPARS